jgi:hypothetical protein
MAPSLAVSLLLLSMLESTQSARRCMAGEVMMFCNQHTADSPKSSDGYADAKANCFPQLMQVSNWRQCLLSKSETRRAYIETSTELAPTPGMSFNWASYDQLRMHMVMDCGLCLAEQSKGYVPLLPVPEYLTKAAEGEDTPGLQKKWKGCTSSDIAQYCLANSWQAKLFEKSPSFQEAQQTCFPNVMFASECQISSKRLHKVFMDSSTTKHGVMHGKLETGVDSPRSYQDSKLELVRECDLCLSKGVAGYKPLLQASLLMEEFPPAPSNPHSAPPPQNAAIQELQKRVMGQQKDVDMLNNENIHVDQEQIVADGEEQKLLKAQQVQEALFSSMLKKSMGSATGGDGSSDYSPYEQQSAGDSMQRGLPFVVFVSITAAIAFKFLPQQPNCGYGGVDRRTKDMHDEEDEHPLVSDGGSSMSESGTGSVPTYSNPRRRSSAGLEVEVEL